MGDLGIRQHRTQFNFLVGGVFFSPPWQPQASGSDCVMDRGLA